MIGQHLSVIKRAAALGQTLRAGGKSSAYGAYDSIRALAAAVKQHKARDKQPERVVRRGSVSAFKQRQNLLRFRAQYAYYGGGGRRAVVYRSVEPFPGLVRTQSGHGFGKRRKRRRIGHAEIAAQSEDFFFYARTGKRVRVLTYRLTGQGCECEPLPLEIGLHAYARKSIVRAADRLAAHEQTL